MNWILAAVAGFAVGFAVRVATPWLARLRRRERPFRGPWVELITAGLFSIVYAGAGFEPRWLVFATLVAAVTSTDLLAKLIPDRITFTGTLVGVVFSGVQPQAITGYFHHRALLDGIGFGGGWLLAILGAATGFLVFEGMRRLFGLLAKMEVMGMGDSKLMMLMGAFLGPETVLFGLLPGLLCGLVLGVIYTQVARTPHFPFGPALGLGGLLTGLFCHDLRAALASGVAALQETSGPGLVVMQLVLLGVAVWLILRVRKRSREYTKRIEEDYEKLDRE